ncbi:hypothetical protein ABPG72_004483 [Tetrahymena utriculariae]
MDEEVFYDQQIFRLLSIPIDKRSLQENQKIRDFLQNHPLNLRYKFRNEAMMQICMNAELRVHSSNHIIYQQNDISEKLFVILKGQVGIYFPKDFKQRYEDLRNELSNDIFKYPVSDYKKLLKFINFKEKDSWFGEVGLVNHSITNQTAIAETEVYLMIIDSKYFQRYIYDKELHFIKKKMKIFQSNLFSDCSVAYQRLMLYMSSKQKYAQKQSVITEHQNDENVYIIRKGEFGVYKQIQDEDSMFEKMNNPLKQVTNPADQLMRKKQKDNKRYTKNTKLKVIQINDVVGEHDVIMRRPASYSCICEGYEGGSVQVIPSLIFLHVIEQDEIFHNSLKDKLKAKMIDFNDRVHRISSQMQKFGDFFFFKSRQVIPEKTYVKQTSVFEIDNQTKKIKKINLQEIGRQNDSQDETKQVNEIKQIVNKIQKDNEKEGEDHNDFTYFPFNTNIHQKIHYQNTLPISSKDFEMDILKPKQLKEKNNINSSLNPPSQRQSQVKIPELNDNDMQQNKIKNNPNFRVSPLKSQNSLQEMIASHRKHQDTGFYSQRRYYSSQRVISNNYDEAINNISNFDYQNEQAIPSQLSTDNQNNNFNNISRTSLDEQAEKSSKSPIRLLSRRTIVLTDKDLINEEEEQHQSSSCSSLSIQQKSNSSRISQVAKQQKSIMLDKNKDLLSPTQISPVQTVCKDNHTTNFIRKQKKALTIQAGYNYQSEHFKQIPNDYDHSTGKKKNIYIDEDKPLQYFENLEVLQEDKMQQYRQTHSVYSQQVGDNIESDQHDLRQLQYKQFRENFHLWKVHSQSKFNDTPHDEGNHGFNITPKNITNSSAFSIKNPQSLKLQSSSNISVNSKITDKFLQRAIEESQFIKNEVLNQKDFIQVTDLKSQNKNELKSLIEIKNLQKKMTQKQDPTKYDDLIKTTQMRVLNLNIKLNEQKNKSQLQEERQLQEIQKNSLDEEQKEQIIRKHISKIGLISPQNSKILIKAMNSVSSFNSFTNSESVYSGSASTGRNMLRQMQIKSLQNKPISSDQIGSPLNNYLIKAKKNEKQKKVSQFHIKAEPIPQHQDQNEENLNIELAKSDNAETPINGAELQRRDTEDGNQSTTRMRGSFFSYNDYAYSTPQSKVNLRFSRKYQFQDPLNIGLKNISTFFNKQEISQNQNQKEEDDDQNNKYKIYENQKQNKKKMFHFKSSVDEYLELKARALSNNFDKKKIKNKDLPFLDSYANQLQINLKRLFYLKLKENYCKETGFSNVQQRVADQILDKNFQMFLKENKDIIPEKKNLNYLYNWRNSEPLKGSVIEKIQHQLHLDQKDQPNYLEGNIPVQGFTSKSLKLPNLSEKKRNKQYFENNLHNTQSQIQGQTSIVLDRQNQSIAQLENINTSIPNVTSRHNISNAHIQEGRNKIINQRAQQFYENLQNIYEKKKKQMQQFKKVQYQEINSSLNVQQKSQITGGISSQANIKLAKKASYKEFNQAYDEDLQMLEELQNQVKNELVLLDKFFKTNKKAEEALKNDDLIEKRNSSQFILSNQNYHQRKSSQGILNKQGTFDSSKLEEEFKMQQYENQSINKSQIDGNEDLQNKHILSPVSNVLRQKSSSCILEIKNRYASPQYISNVPRNNIKSLKQIPSKTVEEEMKQLTHSIILKYGLQSKFKTKKFK